VRHPLIVALVVGFLALSCSSGEPDRSNSPQSGVTSSASSASPTTSLIPKPGWSRFAVEGFELALPARFKGGDIDEALDAIADGEGRIVEQARQSLEVIRELAAFRLFTFDAEADPGDYVTNVSVLAVPMLDPSAAGLLRVAKRQYAELAGFTVVDAEVVFLGEREVAHLIVDSAFPFGTVRQFHYYLPGLVGTWLVNYAALASDASEWRPIFEESASTIRLT